MEATPSIKTEGTLGIWSIRSSQDLSNFATGSDKDIGGLSTCVLGVEESEGLGRFYGTISSDLPRGSRIERSGYAAFRNKNRPTLLGSQTWDTSHHPYLALRVRNRFGKPNGGSQATHEEPIIPPSSSSLGPSAMVSSPILRQALHATSAGRSPIEVKAIHALGIGLKEPPGPKYFINVQTDGPVTSDLFQHRLYFDERAGDAWQTVLVPLDDFVLTNTGQVAASQVTMMREKVRTIGISVVLETPHLHLVPRAVDGIKTGSQAPPAALQRQSTRLQDQDDFGSDGSLRSASAVEEGEAAVRGRRRGQTFNFDLGIESVYATGSTEDEHL